MGHHPGFLIRRQRYWEEVLGEMSLDYGLFCRVSMVTDGCTAALRICLCQFP